MKKLLISAFACTVAMLIACGDDSSSANSAESSSSNWAHEDVGGYLCLSDKDTASVLGYAFEGPDSAMEVIRYEYPEILEDIENVCKDVEAEKAKEDDCKRIDKISESLKTMTFDSLKALMEKECKAGSIMNTVDITNPDEAPENWLGEGVYKGAGIVFRFIFLTIPQRIQETHRI